MLRLISAGILLMLTVAPCQAERLQLTGTQVSTALNGRTIEGAGTTAWRQAFYADGRTSYTSRGDTTDGHWKIRNNQYCSQWPPSETWSCYTVAADDDVIIFISATGTEFPGRLLSN